MIDVKKIKSGDSLWAVKYEELWVNQYGDDAIEIPVGVTRKFVLDVTDGIIRCTDTTRLSERSLFYTRKEANDMMLKQQKEDWEYYKCDVILDGLQKLKKCIEEAK